MDEELRALERELADLISDLEWLLENLFYAFGGEQGPTWRELFHRLRGLILNNPLLLRYLILLWRRGLLAERFPLIYRLWWRILPRGVPAAGSAVEGGAAAVIEGEVAVGAGATTTGAGAGAVVTGGVVVGLVLITIGAIAYIVYVWRRGENPPPPTESGPPCGDPTGKMATLTYGPISGWAFSGEDAAFADAMEKAQKECNKLASNCTGDCPSGRDCRPNVSVQNVTYHWRGAWTTCKITYRCPCECLPHVDVLPVE